MSEPQQRRQHPRANTHLRVSFAVVVPEDTFAPRICEAVVCDISAGGAMVAVRLPEELYSTLLHATRYVRITFRDEELLPHRLIGRAVYIQPISQGERREYRIGVCFDEIAAADRARVQAYVDRLLGTQAPDSPSGSA
jgi:c-di-GMP-binding flagellar brake protein YcgR